MNSDSRNVDTVLARKIAQAGQSAVQTTRPLLRALRRGLAQASAGVSGPAMAVIGATENSLPRDSLSAHLQDQRLMLVLGEPGGLNAAFCVDRIATAAMIRHQTMGEVSTQPPDDRPFTDTDAALLAPLAERLLTEAADLLGEAEDWLCMRSYRFENRQKKLSDLILILGQERYRLCDLVVDIGHGVCQGQITVILPDRPPEQVAEPEDVATEPVGLERNFGLMRTELQVVLTRLQVPLSTLSGLKPGDALPLDSCQLDEAELLTIDGRAVARARLGQCRGMRALRLNETPPDLPSEPDDAGGFDDLSGPAQNVPAAAAIAPPSAAQDASGTNGPTMQEEPHPGTEIAPMIQAPSSAGNGIAPRS
ncbi:FliM/FliN family flagellar motor switch protein [Ruegeria sp. 2012CJ41-6]|uniref:FliM/FliN family flagellar motor switch protein n=1 Tax=Ruegeria spongiae TaxID=2942209 RepID=A0ABT0Q0P5_9RHOB|nr:flagellar motor switch protein FliM [Ruegeria spongiae]MCL6283456.1 FliM/FliN family flagellar motor switch protein [Ruegeria spongiae]